MRLVEPQQVHSRDWKMDMVQIFKLSVIILYKFHTTCLYFISIFRTHNQFGLQEIVLYTLWQSIKYWNMQNDHFV